MKGISGRYHSRELETRRRTPAFIKLKTAQKNNTEKKNIYGKKSREKTGVLYKISGCLQSISPRRM